MNVNYESLGEQYASRRQAPRDLKLTKKAETDEQKLKLTKNPDKSTKIPVFSMNSGFLFSIRFRPVFHVFQDFLYSSGFLYQRQHILHE